MSLTAQRNALASSMIGMLEGAAFDHTPIDESAAAQLIQAAESLIASVDAQ